MIKITYLFVVLLLSSCSSVLTDLASFKDPDFENREPVKVMALIVNNTTMQNINRVQFALKNSLNEENIDVKFLDHYLINPPTRVLSESDLKKSLMQKWKADALLFVNVISETGKVKGVDGDYVDADQGLKEKGKSDKYTTIAYGKYTASLLDIKTWRTIWKADLVAIDEKFKNTKAMYKLAAEKIVLDLLDKKLLSLINDKNKNNITEYDKTIALTKTEKILNNNLKENHNENIENIKDNTVHNIEKLDSEKKSPDNSELEKEKINFNVEEVKNNTSDVSTTTTEAKDEYENNKVEVRPISNVGKINNQEYKTSKEEIKNTKEKEEQNKQNNSIFE